MEGLEIMISAHQHMDPMLGQSDMFLSCLNTHKYSPDKGAGAVSAKSYWAKKGTDGFAGVIFGSRVLELAAASREATHWHGAR
jgi:hypothetical protein